MIHAQPFFAGVVQREIQIRGRPARSPTFYREVRLRMGVFTADLAACRAELAGHPLAPLAIAPGRGLVAIHAFAYRDTDVGPYDELAVSIAVGPPAERLPGPLAVARSVLSGLFHAVVVAMPVTTDIALWGGLDYFNFPKYLADIAFAESATAMTCTLADRASGALELELVGRRLPPAPAVLTGPRVCTFTSYPIFEGRLCRARVRLHVLERGVRYLGTSLALRLGTGPNAERLARLGLGRQLLDWDVPRAEAILYAPEPLAKT